MKISICITLFMVFLVLVGINFKKDPKDPKDSEKSKTDYILICDNFSDGIINSTVCSNNSTFKLVPLENKNER